jgi:tetratricopeptide (TPR) repeat protein
MRTVRIEVLIAKGALLRQTGQVDRALEAYAETYALLARHGPRHLLAHVLNNLGVACASRAEYTDALRMYLASIAVSREIGHRDRLGMTLSNAGQTHAALGHTERALAFLRKALEVLVALGGRAQSRADAHVALAEVHCARGETEAALAEIEKARAIAEAAGTRYTLVRVKLGEAMVALARGEYRAARASAEEAERVAGEGGIVAYALQARAFAAEGAAGTGDRAAAQRYVDAVLADPCFADPLRIERGDTVLAACERALRTLGDHARADALAAARYRRGGGATATATEGAGAR